MASSALSPMQGMKFGCDPELFVVDPDGNFVCADGLIPGTKEEPYKVDKGAVQVDGFAAEFNTDPAETYEEFSGNVSSVLKTLKSMLPKGYDLRCVPVAEFSEKVWEEAPDRAKVLGCTPDFNAWTGDVNPPPDTSANPRMRTASGHLHIGWTEDADLGDPQHIMNCRDLVKQLDWYLGGWSLRIDEDPTRRLLYGKAGAMRFKPYGVEYRVLSNFWLDNGNRRIAVWNRMQQAIHDMRNNYIPDSANWFGFNKILIQSIDTSTRDPSLERKFSFPLTRIG